MRNFLRRKMCDSCYQHAYSHAERGQEGRPNMVTYSILHRLTSLLDHQPGLLCALSLLSSHTRHLLDDVFVRRRSTMTLLRCVN